MREVIAALRAAKTVVMSLHRQPDGDSIGSTAAIALALRRLGKDVTLVTPDPVPKVYDLVPTYQEFVPWESVAERRFDLVAMFDCADERRTGAPSDLTSYGARVLNVDHHATNTCFGDVVFIDPQAAASAEIAARVIDQLGVTIDREIALALYVGLETDTGGFRYAATTPDSHRLAARLLDAGLEPGEISQALYERQAVSGLRLLGAALQSLQVREDLSLAYVVLSAADFARSGAAAADVETLGVVDYARRVDGIEVGALLREEGPGQVKLSLRSKGLVDVARLAASLGGGGHERAAGATLAMSLQEAEATLLSLLRP
ncbi:MAG: bifunctional oligoribonuclease/PAP phosphatase NrnA [Thermaerobacter sp.]|nr:bifunctional oligoribonuclease/PAP phosphatase NrnA [Thermaerobacter sp.]